MPGMHKPVPVVSHGEEITLQLTVMACEPALEDAKSSSKACCYRIDASTELSVTTSSSSSSSLSPSSSSDAAFSGIGGLDAQISQVCDLLDQALHSNQTFAEYGIKPPCGVLLHGPPGTGKSMLARALKGYCGTEVAFYSISGPEVVSRFSGDSEKKLRELWKEARAHEPSVIFIDEVDAICVSRDADTGDLQKRITATVMTLMDGLSGTTSSSSSSSSPSLGRVCVVGATNSPNTLDSALRRPGRFDREIEVGIPTAKQRRAILDCMLRGVTHGLSEGEVGQVTAQAHGFVGADLESLLSEAGIECFRRLEAQAHLDPLGGDAKDWECVLAYNDVQRALKRVKPSTLREFLIDVPSVKWVRVCVCVCVCVCVMLHMCWCKHAHVYFLVCICFRLTLAACML
jgi:ATP-dependent 26S proteasome regulatory subunit